MTTFQMKRVLMRALAVAQSIQPADGFLAALEESEVTLAPLRLRQTADLYGTAVLIRTPDGYEVLDPEAYNLQRVIPTPAAKP